MKEYKELKAKNEEYKGALKVFKNKLNEVALFNTNLAYVNRLFTEHSTTRSEKMEILKKFNIAESGKTIAEYTKKKLDEQVDIRHIEFGGLKKEEAEDWYTEGKVAFNN